METEINFDTAIMAIDGRHGIYVPKIFVEQYAQEDNIFNLHPEDKADILDGPDNDYYWDAWANVVDTCKVAVNGILHAIHEHEGDIWLYQTEQ